MFTRQTRSAAVAHPQTAEVTVTFTADELEKLEAIASLHDLYVPEFLHNVALEAAHLKKPSQKGQAESVDAGWLTEAFEETPENTSEAKEARIAQKAKTANAVLAPEVKEPITTSAPKKGVVGEQSSLAKGSGPVWEIRQALGKERLHGLGWTREHLAFVLKLSVVGVRKLEHTAAAPVKSKVAREQLLGLAKAVKEPTPEILAYIKNEEAR